MKPRVGTLPLFANGRTIGGQRTLQAQATDPLPDVRGLVFFAFPLHSAGKSSTDRAAHLADVGILMLFAQGTRDARADMELLRPVLASLGGRRAPEAIVEAADHSFHVPISSGGRDPEVLAELLDATARWRIAAGQG